MDASSPQRVVEDGLQVYDEAPHHYSPPKAGDAYHAPDEVVDEKAFAAAPVDGKRDRIAGLKPGMFWIVIVLIALIVIGASVGGAVGGTRASKNDTPASAQSTVSSPSQLSSPTSGSTSILLSASSTPLTSGYNISTDCPTSSGTSYTSPAYFGGPGVYTFAKTCGSNTGGIDLISAFTPDFNTCIDLCSNWNYKIYETGLSGVRCTSAVFLVGGSPPNNCWAKNGTDVLGDRSTGLALLTSA